MRHFHEKLQGQHHSPLSYTWVKLALQSAGLVQKARQRRPLPGMLLHLDGSSRAWLDDGSGWILLVLLDDATGEIYYAQLVAAEFTRTVLQAPPQVGSGLRELGIRMIAAHSPQARGRNERNFGTWQGWLPQDLHLPGIHTVEKANQFLREEYIAEFNGRFRLLAAQPGDALVPCRRQDLERIFSVQLERVVNLDNAMEFGRR